MQLSVAATSARSFDIAASINTASVQVIVVPAGSFIRANAEFWTEHGGDRLAAVLAGRWIEVPGSRAAAVTAAFGQFTPSRFAHCLTQGHGTLTVGGLTTVDGRPAVIVRDAGNAPGDQPGTLAVATTGSPYPLRLTGSGRHPGVST
jgi:hypothetical protein